jgi:stage II sporulation protein B
VVPERTYYFVQNGVFSSREGAAAALGLLKEKGLSGAVEAGDAYSVYAGAAANRDDALLIGHHLQNEGFEVYVKPYVLPAFDAAVSGGAAEELAEYLRRSRELAGAVLEICAVRLNEARPEPLAEAEAERLKRLHQQWTEQANRLAASASSDPVQEKLNTALNSAMLTLERYDKDPVHAYLWQAQAAAADHIIAQRAFLAAPDL